MMYDEIVKAMLNTVSMLCVVDQDVVTSGPPSSATVRSAYIDDESSARLSAQLPFHACTLISSDRDGVVCSPKPYVSRGRKQLCVRRRRTISAGTCVTLAGREWEEYRTPVETTCDVRTSLKRKPSPTSSERMSVVKQAAVSAHNQKQRHCTAATPANEGTSSSSNETAVTNSTLNSRTPPATVATNGITVRRHLSSFLPAGAGVRMNTGSRAFIAKTSSVTAVAARRLRRPPPYRRSKRPLNDADVPAAGGESDDSISLGGNAASEPRSSSSYGTMKSHKLHITEDYLVSHLRAVVISDTPSKQHLETSLSDSLALLLNERLGIFPPASRPGAGQILNSNGSGNTAPVVASGAARFLADLHDKSQLVIQNGTLSCEKLESNDSVAANDYDADDEEDLLPQKDGEMTAISAVRCASDGLPVILANDQNAAPMVKLKYHDADLSSPGNNNVVAVSPCQRRLLNYHWQNECGR